MASPQALYQPIPARSQQDRQSSTLHRNFAYNVQKHNLNRPAANPSMRTHFKQPSTALTKVTPSSSGPGAPRHRPYAASAVRPAANARSSTELVSSSANPLFRSNFQPARFANTHGSQAPVSSTIAPRPRLSAIQHQQSLSPVARSNTTRMSIPTSSETVSPFRRLYSSTNGRNGLPLLLGVGPGPVSGVAEAHLPRSRPLPVGPAASKLGMATSAAVASAAAAPSGGRGGDSDTVFSWSTSEVNPRR